ncbi:discoidin domain-containing protein [Kitasatospora sp. NPDC057015]|uniref:discoidin domain-containing protein n=1 Tax=Kitasatospora sp. NPDC057015 TaxID=3346001 RepID=UPI003637902B
MTVKTATLRQAGTYFAQQFSFTNSSSGAYAGLQPRADLNGHQRLHAAFSSFIANTTSTDSNCSNGADGGAGVSCASDFDGVYGHEYAIKVALTGTDAWTGTATDTVTGVANHIGTFKLPSGSGNLNGSHGGFVEYYRGSPSCDQLPKIDVVFGAPTTTDAGTHAGTAKANYEYNDCIGTADYTAITEGNGTHITRGWITNGPDRIAQSSMSVKSVDSAETAAETAPGTNVLDGKAATAWVTKWSGTAAPMPHEIQLDLGKNYSVTDLYYLPRSGTANGRIKDYKVYTSTDGTTWGTAVATGAFPNSATEQDVRFSAVTARYVRLVATSEVNGNPWTAIAELNIAGT